jgi:hypothetical protein
MLVIGVMAQMGFSVSDYWAASPKQRAQMVDRANRAVLHVDWKVISVFPEKGKRFKR